MKIILIPDPINFIHPGGGEVELLNYQSIINRNGIQCDILGSNKFQIEYYDICIVFSLTEFTHNLVKKILNIIPKIYIIPMLWFNQYIKFSDDYLNTIRNVTGLIFESESEKKIFCKYTNINEIKYQSIIINRFISEKFQKKLPNDFFESITGISDFSLMVGILDINKNQLPVIEIFKNNPHLNLVYIGGYRDAVYYQKCFGESRKNIHYLGYLSPNSDLIISAYREANNFIELSKEPSGLSSLEACFSSCPMILADEDWERELFGDCKSAILISRNFSRDKILKIIQDHKRVEKYGITNSRFTATPHGILKLFNS